MAHEIESEIGISSEFGGAGVDDAKAKQEYITDLPTDPLADLIRHAATNLDRPPRYTSTSTVACVAGKLSRIIWQGDQWAVTAYGIECRDGTYTITKHRLWENEGGQGCWVRHMAGKGWVDVHYFSEALRIARGRHARHDSER